MRHRLMILCFIIFCPFILYGQNNSISDNVKDKNGIFHNQENNTQVVETFVDGNCGISSVSEQYTRTGYYLRKFMHWKTNKNQDLNGYWSYYRLAEMYLNYAEAMLEYKGACDEVYDAINVVRTRAKMPNLVKGTMDTDELRLRLRNERRVEFAFEEPVNGKVNG